MRYFIILLLFSSLSYGQGLANLQAQARQVAGGGGGTPVVFLDYGTAGFIGNLGGSWTPSYPATVNADDYLILHITTTVGSSSEVSFATPSGWTLVYDQSHVDSGGTGEFTSSMFVKVAAGTESGTITLSTTGAIVSGSAVISRWDNVNTTTSYEQNAIIGPDTYDVSTGTGTGLVTTSVTSSSNNAMAVAFFSMGDLLTQQQAPTLFTNEAYYEQTGAGADSHVSCYYESIENAETIGVDAQYWNSTSERGATITLILLPE